MALFPRKVRLPIERTAFMAMLSGAESGLATTTAVACGIFITLDDPELVLLTVAVSFMVQAFNSSAGWFFVQQTQDEIDQPSKLPGISKPLQGAAIQFTSHVVTSLLVVLPLIFIENSAWAVVSCAGLALLFLFILGGIKGKMVQKSFWSDGLTAMTLGAMIISLGIFTGLILHG